MFVTLTLNDIFQHASCAHLSQRSAVGGEGDVEQLGLTSDDHASLAGELKVGGDDTGVDLADELAGGVPDVDAVAAAGVDAAL